MAITPDFLFALANPIAMIGWVLLIVAPRWSLTRRLVLSGALPLLLAVAYVLLIGSHYLGASASEGGFSSLQEVAALFRDPWALLAGWVHYLCFDMSIGIWETHDAHKRGIPHLLLVPALVFTFLFGPLGLLLYAIIRRWYPAPALAS
ncbi:ABA4-like family protein [Hymenobacter volaticus]|uniref:ABA4-like family protein n=1 Tax=Hymenobacter volaticus TaxID=2932254 RepID=A0ABY4G2B7_9BACT|nr:ABA4-like family protein [Hymenobacter volaticus]UOQ65020.1 ABA4-like family protein [Hymenobacter volaticus]